MKGESQRRDGIVQLVSLFVKNCDGDGSDEEVEKEEEKADSEQDGTAVDATAREATQPAKEASRGEFEAALLAEAVKSTTRGVTDQAAADCAHLIIHPGGNFEAVVPEKDGACGEER